MRFRWSVSEAVLAVFNECTFRQRRRLLDLFNRVAEFPLNCSDDVDHAPNGRAFLVAHLSGWKLTYWIDPDGNEVHFIRLEPIS